MTDLIVVPQAAHWQRLKRLVLDSVSSPITRRVYNLGLDEFFEWYEREPRPGFTKATVSAWRVALEARGLGAVSINVRITAVRKLAVEAADNGLLAPELANGITRVKGVASKGIRLGNWLSVKQAQTLLNTPDVTTTKGLRDRAILAVLLGCGLRRSEVAALTVGLTGEFASILGELVIPQPILAWLGDSVLESDRTEQATRERTIKRLEAAYDRLKARIETMYLDKLDGRISGEFFDQRCAEWRREQDGLLRKIQEIRKAAPAPIEQAIDTLRLTSQACQMFQQQPATEQRR